MPERDRPHLQNPVPPDSDAYTPHSMAIPPKALQSPSNRLAHATGLSAEFAEATAHSDSAPVSGTYVVFESFPGVDLALETMDPRPGRSTKPKPELRSVVSTDVNGEAVEQATVFVPDDQLKYFVSRIEKYLATADAEKPKSAAFVDTISRIRKATVRALWTDGPAEYPSESEVVWWEVWLRRRDGSELTRLRELGQTNGFRVSERFLGFSDRIVGLVRASAEQLSDSLELLDDLAELRKPHDSPYLIARDSGSDQQDWSADLDERLDAAEESAVAVCVIDTGVARSHPLLSRSLSESDMHSVDPNWSVLDHDGHGTEMSGLALFGRVDQALISADRVQLTTRLESVKILPPEGENDPQMYGALTAIAVSLPEIAAPGRRRVFSMAITDTTPNESNNPGQPTSWSSSIDALAAGRSIDVDASGLIYLDEEADPSPRLIVLAAGNVRAFEVDHITRSQLEPIEDPAQSWNALTVGAHTELDDMTGAPSGFEGHSALAARGELSPSSRTSYAFGRNWPVKPDVVFEGGNLSVSPDSTHIDTPDNLALLTTAWIPQAPQRLITTTRETSAATSQAANFAARLMQEYPAQWPETIRALVVHSADWTPAMMTRFNAASGKRERARIARMYGMGVPDYERASRSASDSLTLISQATIHPFDGEGRMGEVNFHSMPWPTQELQDLGSERVRMRVTLSYFIEPNPARRGWRRRYSYASHGLRFEIRRASEATDDFRKRVNAKALLEDERRPSGTSDSDEWNFGAEHRQAAGSLHADVWTGTAAELADRSAIAVFPVTGWWKEYPTRDQSERGVRYSLVVSLEAEGLGIDIWTPVAQQIGVPIPV